MPQVNIISKSKVQFPSGELPPPGWTIPLSFFDAWFIEFPRTDFVLLYPDAPKSPSTLHSLKSSLARMLPHFHPFGGDLTYLPSSHDVAIICSKDSGVVVFEAESTLDIRRLSDLNGPDEDAFHLLVPSVTALELPVPVLVVQLTSFYNGGVAVGISLHHAATDGWGIWQFMDCWAKTCHDGEVSSEFAPVHDRAAIIHPHKEEMKKKMLKLYAPNIPKIDTVFYKPIANPIQSTTRTFNVDLSTIQLLKKRIVQATNASDGPPPTTFQVLAAHFWISVAYANGLTSDDTTPALMEILMNCRTLLDPTVDAAYTGNCVRSVFIESQGTSLMGQGGLSKTCLSIAKAISIAKERPLEGIMENPVRSFDGPKVFIGGSNRLQVYNADFGWGKPSLHTLVQSMDGLGVMTAGKEDGIIEFQVFLKEGMKKFVHAFEGGMRY